MFKNFLIASAMIIISPTFGFADDIFFAWEQGADASDTSTATTADGSGSVFVYSDVNFGFDAADLDFTNSNPNVIQFTGGEGFNPEFDILGDTRFDSAEIPSLTATDGRLLLINVIQNGVNPGLRNFDPGFDSAVNVNGSTDGAILLARLDYDIVGAGTANLEFTLGTNGVLLVPDQVLNPSLGAGALTVTSVESIPEPSSFALLMLTSIGVVTRRKRA